MRGNLTIGKLAESATVNIETIRYYQRLGLLAVPEKPSGGHRRYGPEVAKRVRFIRRAQALGFTLEEVGGLLRLDAANACAETRELASQKLMLIEKKLGDLRTMREGLAALVAKCDTGGDRACPIIEVLISD